MARRKKKCAKPGTKSRTAQGPQGRIKILPASTFMAARSFVRGFDEARRGAPFDYGFIDGNLSHSVEYAAGRQFGLVVKSHVALRAGRRWKKVAEAMFIELVRRGDVRA